MKVFIRYILLVQALLFFLGTFTLQGQVEFPGEALGINRHLKAASVIYTLPPPDPMEIAALQESTRDSYTKPLRFAIIRQVDLSPEANGSWSEEGDLRVWRLHLISPGAYSLGVIFNRYVLEAGVKLFVYDPGQTRVKGAFTSGNNKKSGRLSVGHIPGQEVVIEMQVPGDMIEYGELELESLSHAFIDLNHRSIAADCGPGEFGCAQDCEIDVNCVEGDDWWRLKPSVVMLYIEKSGFHEYCTGVLVNNTAYDGTPYIITAQHCIGNTLQAERTLVYFNYESAECFGQDGPLNMSIYGSELLTVGDSIDFSLVKLSLEPPASYKAYYAGWDRSDFQTTPGTTLHHPWGDVKKISIDYEIPSIPAQPGDVPYADLEEYHYFSYWWIREWDVGTTEGGSSGGPLFNTAGRVIGTLSGGRATCGDSIDYDPQTDRVIYNLAPNYDDYYARFGMAWDYEEEKGIGLAPWLDPLNTGVGTLGGYNPTAVAAPQAPGDERFKLFPNPASTSFSIKAKNPSATEGSYLIRNLSGALLGSGELDFEGRAKVDIAFLPSGLYLVSVQDGAYWEHHKLIVTGR